MLTAKAHASRSSSWRAACRPSTMPRSGGSSESETIESTVRPADCPPAVTVTTPTGFTTQTFDADGLGTANQSSLQLANGATNLLQDFGYRGPGFGVAPMPDQYTLLALQLRELAKRDRPPLFAEVDLISSHAPWTRIPRLISWGAVGDGSIFDRLPAGKSTKASLFGDAERARAAYGQSIEYSLNTIFSFVQRYGDDNLVLVVLGDHQPATVVTGQGASHDVPISVIAHDPKVMDQITGWRWQDGMSPSPQAPVWPMAAFRDRFLSAFGSPPAGR